MPTPPPLHVSHSLAQQSRNIAFAMDESDRPNPIETDIEGFRFCGSVVFVACKLLAAHRTPIIHCCKCSFDFRPVDELDGECFARLHINLIDVLDGRTMQSTPESGERAGYDGYKRKKGSKVHAAVDTLGHLLALKVTAASSGSCLNSCPTLRYKCCLEGI